MNLLLTLLIFVAILISIFTIGFLAPVQVRINFVFYPVVFATLRPPATM